jgi:hypothetical protein
VALRVCRVDGFLEHETNLYSVPYEYIADILTVKATKPRSSYTTRSLRSSRTMKESPWAPAESGRSQPSQIGKGALWLEPVKEAFLALGDCAHDFLNGLKDRHPHHCGFQARYILRLKERYHCQDIHAALVHATKYYAFDAKTIERILKARFSRGRWSSSAGSVSKAFRCCPKSNSARWKNTAHLFKESYDAR